MRYSRDLRLDHVCSEISKLILNVNFLHRKKKEIEASTVKGQKVSDMPRAKPEFEDGKFINVCERISEIDIEIQKNVKLLSDLENKKRDLTETIDKMPDCSFKAISSLYFINGMSPKDISNELGCPLKRIYSYIHDFKTIMLRE